jgi:hypothetical protein
VAFAWAKENPAHQLAQILFAAQEAIDAVGRLEEVGGDVIAVHPDMPTIRAGLRDMLDFHVCFIHNYCMQ